MSNYTNTYGGLAKDAAEDIILGDDLDTEFDAIAVSSATKANKVVGGTTDNILVDSGSGDLKDGGVTIAALKSLLEPIGTIWQTTVAGDAGTQKGFGGWTQIAQGRTLIGEGAGAGLTSRTAGATGGVEDAVVVTHNHGTTEGFHGHPTRVSTSVQNSFGSTGSGGFPLTTVSDANYAAHTSTTPAAAAGDQIGTAKTNLTINNDGVSGVDKNMQPYLVVYVWERTS